MTCCPSSCRGGGPGRWSGRARWSRPSVGAPATRGVDARRTGRGGGGIGLGRLRRVSRVRPRAGSRGVRRLRCSSATASRTTTPSPSGSPVAASSTSSSSPCRRRASPSSGSVVDDIESGRPVAVATVVGAPGCRMARPPPRDPAGGVGMRESDVPRGTVGGRADAAVTDDARGLLAWGRTETLTYGRDGERRGEGMRVFVATHAPRPRMLVFGAIDSPLPWPTSARSSGTASRCATPVPSSRPRPGSRRPTTSSSMPHRYLAAEAAAGRVDSRTVICVLTHDPKFDVPVLEAALRLPEVAYVGAMGSRRTHEQRIARLREAGARRPRAGAAVLADRPGPRGPDAGGDSAVDRRRDRRSPVGWGRGRLHDVAGPIHHHPT